MVSRMETRSAPVCDVVIRNGEVYDGANSPPAMADVAIDGGKVQSVAPSCPTPAARDRCPRVLGHARHARYPHTLRRRSRGHAWARGIGTARGHHGRDGQLLAVGGAGRKEGYSRSLLPRGEFAARRALALAGRCDSLARRPRILCPPGTSAVGAERRDANRTFQRPRARDGHGAQPEGEQGRG